jgi:hypothetical protein
MLFYEFSIWLTYFMDFGLTYLFLFLLLPSNFGFGLSFCGSSSMCELSRVWSVGSEPMRTIGVWNKEDASVWGGNGGLLGSSSLYFPVRMESFLVLSQFRLWGWDRVGNVCSPFPYVAILSFCVPQDFCSSGALLVSHLTIIIPFFSQLLVILKWDTPVIH